jgi:hypothetical protein
VESVKDFSLQYFSKKDSTTPLENPKLKHLSTSEKILGKKLSDEKLSFKNELRNEWYVWAAVGSRLCLLPRV